MLLSLIGLQDNTEYRSQGWITIDRSMQFDLYVMATLGASMDCDVKLLGIKT